MSDQSPFKHAKADDSAGFLLWKLTALWQRKLRVVFDGFGITQTHYALLASLRWFEEHREPTTQALLARHARIAIRRASVQSRSASPARSIT